MSLQRGSEKANHSQDISYSEHGEFIVIFTQANIINTDLRVVDRQFKKIIVKENNVARGMCERL